MKSLAVTLALIASIVGIVRATADTDVDPVTLAPAIPGLVAGPRGLTDAEMREANAGRTRVSYPGSATR